MVGKQCLCEQGMFMEQLLRKVAFLCVRRAGRYHASVCGGHGNVLFQDSLSIQNSLDQ